MFSPPMGSTLQYLFQVWLGRIMSNDKTSSVWDQGKQKKKDQERTSCQGAELRLPDTIIHYILHWTPPPAWQRVLAILIHKGFTIAEDHFFSFSIFPNGKDFFVYFYYGYSISSPSCLFWRTQLASEFVFHQKKYPDIIELHITQISWVVSWIQ